MNWNKSASIVLFSALFTFFTAFQTSAQVYQRPRVVPTAPNQTQVSHNAARTSETSPAPTKNNSYSRPVLTNQLVVAAPVNQPASLVKKTVSSMPSNAAAYKGLTGQALAAFNARLNIAMNARLGIPYVYGSNGPNTYDCSSLVWSVFRDAGFSFERTSARSYWQNFEPVTGDERFQFGTLVFFNKLGHVGIVVDEKGFYHASSSKGVTYSSFDGYWSKRIVGFRRIPVSGF